MSDDGLSVAGGSHGLVVQHAEARGLATAYDASGDRLRAWASDDAGLAHDGDLVGSAVFSPGTFAHAEARVLAATTGPVGALVQSLAWEADALAVRGVITAFETADAALAGVVDAVEYSAGYGLGRTVGSTLGAVVPFAGVVGAGAALTRLLAPYVPAAGLATQAAAFDLKVATLLLERSPGAVEHAFGTTGGLVDGFWSGVTGQGVLGPDGRPLLHPSATDAASLLVLLYPADGDPRVSSADPVGDHGPLVTTTPHTVADLVENLRATAELSEGRDSDHNGTIAIQTLDGPVGPRHVVYIPGTDDLASLPWSTDDDVRDNLGNLDAVADRETTYSRGIRIAMREAGIEPGEPVLLVGHSQGGIVANHLANHPGGLAITDAVTLGAPLGAHPWTGAHVLSLENEADLIPSTEGESNDPSPTHTTVRFRDPHGDLAVNHGFDAYAVGAGRVDASADPSLVDAVGRLREGYLTGGGGEVSVWRITRTPGTAD